jgi:hypothetical protein
VGIRPVLLGIWGGDRCGVVEVSRLLVAASLSVVAGVAGNQVRSDAGRVSWNWGYLALVFTVLGLVVEAGLRLDAPATDVRSGATWRRGRGSLRKYLRRAAALVLTVLLLASTTSRPPSGSDEAAISILKSTLATLVALTYSAHTNQRILLVQA